MSTPGTKHAVSAPLTRLISNSAQSQDCTDLRRRDVSCPACIRSPSETSSTTAATPAATNDDGSNGGGGGGAVAAAVAAAVVAVLLLCFGGYAVGRWHRKSAEAEVDPNSSPRHGVSNPIYELPGVGPNKDDGYLDVSAP